MNAQQRLTVALGDLVYRGDSPPCSDLSGGWLSDDPDERAEAALACVGCPLLDPCAAAGETESFGVWGGQDREPVRRYKRQAAS